MKLYSYKNFYTYAVYLCFAIVFAYFISFTFFTKMIMQGLSMSPSISDRDIVLVNRLNKNLLTFNRYDIVAFKINDQESIKRIIGLAGDTVRISSGNIYVNGEKIPETYIKSLLSSNIEQEIKVKENEYYVLGDNLYSSRDSRFSDFGNIKKEQIIGKVWYIIHEK